MLSIHFTLCGSLSFLHVGLAEIPENAFSDLAGLKNIEFYYTVKKLGDGAFENSGLSASERI